MSRCGVGPTTIICAPTAVASSESASRTRPRAISARAGTPASAARAMPRASTARACSSRAAA